MLWAGLAQHPAENHSPWILEQVNMNTLNREESLAKTGLEWDRVILLECLFSVFNIP